MYAGATAPPRFNVSRLKIKVEMQGFDVKPAGRLEYGCDTPSARNGRMWLL